VEMVDVVNCALHVSVNSGARSKVDVKVDRAFNSSVHLSFQNPVRTPVTLMMESPQITQIHVSQNVPRDSTADITIKNPINCHIHSSQSAPQGSPMTFTIEGEDVDNQIEVSQSAADDYSPLTCTPECPQEDYVYQYDYYGGGGGGGSKGKNHQAAASQPPPQQRPQQRPPKQIAQPAAPALPVNSYDDDYYGDGGDYADDELADFPDYSQDTLARSGGGGGGGGASTSSDAAGVGGQLAEGLPEKLNAKDCPGGSIKECIGICPAKILVVYKVCVKSCTSRCP